MWDSIKQIKSSDENVSRFVFTKGDAVKPNPYTETIACVDRLYKQYLKTPKLIIAVDFDQTVFDYHNEGHTYDQVWELLKRCQKQKFYIVCFTASMKGRQDFIIDHFIQNGIVPHGININPIETPFGKDGKISLIY